MGRVRVCGIAATVVSTFILLQCVSSALKSEDSPWYKDLCSYKWEAIDQDSNVRYTLKLCDSSPDTECGKESAVCAHKLKSDQPQSVGELSLQKVSPAVLDFNSSVKCGDDESRNIQSSITFQCGKTMGTPEFVTVSECVHYFEWRTYAACRRDKFKPHKEVPCYVFDLDGKKHDLNPLIKLSDGYLVDDPDDEIDFYINICRSLNRVGSSCPEGSAACLTSGKDSFDMGQPVHQLELLSNDKLKLRYELGKEGPSFCNGHSPAVTITFICPSTRQAGSNPKMINSLNCRYEIEWVTEYACHRDYLESQNCTLTSEQHDISIDLTPLMHEPSGIAYMTEAKNGQDTYIFYLNVCGETRAGECFDGKGYVSACQVKDKGHEKKIAGRFQNQTLRYSDGDLTLIYPDGIRCSTGFLRMTIINFECNATAAYGQPVFTGESDCTYYFDWQTAYACVKEKEDLMCRVTDHKKRYDLSPLTRYPESEGSQNWEAVDGTKTAESDKKRFYINVCHKIIQDGETRSCPEDAAICAVGNGKTMNLGKFKIPPQKAAEGDDIRLIYTDGDKCGENMKVKTIIILKCKPGDVESAPVLTSMSSDGCIYEFEWFTASACVLLKAEGDDCKVEDPQAGISFDLSPLRKPSGGYYNMSVDKYDYFINVCGNVKPAQCPDTAGACQVDQSGTSSWNLGQFNSKLSYYDGMIQLTYRNGSQYNDKRHTQRSTHISFLCDREAGPGKPEFQKEDENTYNFIWYTSYACPERPHECVVTDPKTLHQYDLSSLSVSNGGRNWHAIQDSTDPSARRKYYINICRPLKAVPGCDRRASVCEVKFVADKEGLSEKVEVSNLGIAKKGPVIMEENQLMLEYTNGSVCQADGVMTTYTTRIHFVCSSGTASSGPHFFGNQNCTVDLVWDTAAACAISTVESTNQTCSVKDPNTGFEFNLQSLASESGYHASGNGKDFVVNICDSVKVCGTVGDKPVAGCNLEDKKPVSQVGVERSLQFSTDGTLTLKYKGVLDISSGTEDTYVINFVCDKTFNPSPLELIEVDLGTSAHTIHNVLFEFHTALACEPAPVDCQVTDQQGREYDLGDLSLDDKYYVPLDTSEQARFQKFYISVCKPLPRIQGCPAGAVGACGQLKGRGVNLGYVQSGLQPAADGSISIVYLNGDKCNSGHYSTRIVFQCDDSPGAPMFDRKDDCEYVFIWRTSEACPIKRVQGENCKVKDPKSGYEYNLTPLAGKDYEVKGLSYEYHFAVCGPVTSLVCPHGPSNSVSSCQVKGSVHRIAGLANQNLTFDDGIIMINYTNGEKCHKIYERSTAILFSCDHSKNPGKPEYIKETADCTYLFEWHTALACPSFKTTTCSYNDGNGHSYDLSSLALHKSNWMVRPESTNQELRYYINVCKSLVPQTGLWRCPSSAAACLKDGDEYVNLGEAEAGPQWEKNMLVLKYTNGQACPDGKRNRTTIIRFKCDRDKLDSKPTLITALEDCVYSFVWFTAAACPLSSTEHGDCKVTNPATGHLFDLNPLSRSGGYTVYDPVAHRKIFRLNVCGDIADAGCDSGTAVCIKDIRNVISGGKSTRKLVYKDQLVELTYEDGDACAANPSLKHKSIFSFICKSEGGGTEEPVLVYSEDTTCTHFFSWHTPLVCEQEVKCSIWNGTSLIDLSPLIHLTGYYTAINEDVDRDKSPDFYINICQPLNPIPGVNCPPGAAVCMDAVDGDPVDIGRITSLPNYNNNTNEVEITFSSKTICPSYPTSNYSSKIIFTCQKGAELGSPQMIRAQDCMYVFEWATPVVCPEIITPHGCNLTVSQLRYTFDLSALSGIVQVPRNSSSFKINVCGTVKGTSCKDSAVCLISSGSAASYGNSKIMNLDYKREEQAVIMQYSGGDTCPQVTDKNEVCVFPFKYNGESYNECTTAGMTDGRKWCATTSDYVKDQKWGFCSSAPRGKRQSSILFSCDRAAGRGSPQLMSETQGCSVTFQWRTDVVCPPKKMECKLAGQHQTYDLRTLSSLTEPWKFSNGDDSYYFNLCQAIHGGQPGCAAEAAVCRRRSGGKTETLGRVHTQTMEFTDGKILVNYSMGDEVCGHKKPARTILQLKCGSTVGHPKLFKEDKTACEFWVEWETRSACAVKQEEVEMINGTIKVPQTGAIFSLGALYYRFHNATGDIRPNGDRYIYHIQLSGITDSSISSCLGANICQVKINDSYRRKIGSSSNAKYYIQGGNLEVLVPSESVCGRDKSQTVFSTILFHCSPTAGEGIPEFLLETDGCQYLFVWHTTTICEFFSSTSMDPHSTDGGEEHPGLSGRSQALGAVLSLLLVVLTICLLVLLLHKRDRRQLVIQKVSSCFRKGNPVSYKYSRVNTDEDGCEDEMEWLMEETGTPTQEPQQNGHITTKPVSADALRSFSLDEQDSEDEVLTVPGVRIGPSSSNTSRLQSALLKAESDEDLVGLLVDTQSRNKTRYSDRNQRKPQPDPDDSDEDLLKV
ncbi:cation-independent mannose-6-phosphate receptor [Carassius gibelio]|uniref:cation-independent mannose-6-phosphate receptor n=1 Tax=Carassius gibelio TaxID=101364 RepID=UPI0022795F85|nr:cation-independent mannose-6-phosphate receptor [Carassius gibelio]